MAKLSDAARGFFGAWGFLCAASVSFHAASSTLGVDGCGSPSSRAFAGSSEPPTSPDR